MKRKDPPQSSSNSQRTSSNRRAKRARFSAEKRSISTQGADAALKNGELDLQSFLKAREFEIKALESGMQTAKGVLKLRAFQQVPRDMRRRTAAHNVKRVPKRIQNKARREMILDNASTVDPSKRKPRSSRARIRAETAKRLGILAAKKRATNVRTSGGKGNPESINTRVARPKLRKNGVNDPPKPKSKFRKRQIHKTWLPTHLWHAKRAKMTEPKSPLWRFAMPLTSTEKSYRPTHRAGGSRGALAWDMSYMSTISLEGPVENLKKVLTALGMIQEELWNDKGDKWRTGKRGWNGWLSRESASQLHLIGPATVIWQPPDQVPTNNSEAIPLKQKPLRKLFIRIHPAAFLETWNEALRLSKLQRPAVQAMDLRFEIGSIDITGPGSTEAILGILHPYPECEGGHGKIFKSLAGVTNPGSLPRNSVLSFEIMDPRLQYPPRPVNLPDPTNEAANLSLLETLSSWPADSACGSSSLFDRDLRLKATRLPSQKALNRRKGLAQPGSYPPVSESDPRIPIMLLASRAPSSSAQGTWTLLAPWKCILPIWYGLMHYPLTSGGNPRFGGLQELRQIHFERGTTWFPADLPGTAAGFTWETDERQRRKMAWERRPKGKRVEWDSLDLGAKRKGEVGLGWACDFEKLVSHQLLQAGKPDSAPDTQAKLASQSVAVHTPIKHISKQTFTSLLSETALESRSSVSVASIRITFTSCGIASPCARIYRLPSPPSTQEVATPSGIATRQEWLSLLPAVPGKARLSSKAKSKITSQHSRIPLNTPLPQRVRLLAESLLRTPLPYPPDKAAADGHPIVPDEDDLIGFVTTGEFNLAEGKGVAIGTVLVTKVIEELQRDRKLGIKDGRLCIVRSAGEKIGRLAHWEPV
jgi:ribonuclease P/MRP protein subunit POP1